MRITRPVCGSIHTEPLYGGSKPCDPIWMDQWEFSRRTEKSYTFVLIPLTRVSRIYLKSAAVAGEKRSIRTVPNSPVDQAPPVSSNVFLGFPLTAISR